MRCAYPDITQSRFYQEILQTGQEQGLERGLEQGQEQGREREALLIVRLLQRRLGELPAPLKAQVLGLPIDSLEARGEALLDFTGMGDLVDYLGKGCPS